MQAPDVLPKPVNSLNSLGGPARFARGRPSAMGEEGSAPARDFAQALQSAQTVGAAPMAAAAQSRTVAAGDTLSGIVQEQAAAMGVKVEPTQAYRLAQQLARTNRIDNPDRIFAGQQLDMRALSEQIAQIGKPGTVTTADAAPQLRARYVAQPPAAQALAAVQQSVATSPPAAANAVPPRFPHVATNVALAPNGKPMPVSASPAGNAALHPVLQKTLDRAVAKGFIPEQERAAVYDKILGLAKEHNFMPDDFARMTLMESDGMNPRASNQRCHGIIQFCDGPARGAASAGFGANPRAILDLSVHKQLSLVDKYFDDVGLKSKGPAGLEDLYLSVLNPASRSQSRADAPLNIPGPQARSLHVDRNSAAPITRQSIRQGLLQNAAERLGNLLPPSLRQQAQRAQQYVQNNLP